MNLFNFNYETQKIANKDGSESRFGIVYGESGMVVHTKKDTYTIVPTADFSLIGEAYVNSGYGVNTFVERHGEVIGITIDFAKDKRTLVGDKNYRATITLPNNGGGKGFLSIHEVRLICLNGMTRSKTLNNQFAVKIPHSINYAQSIKLMQETLERFRQLIEFTEAFDAELDAKKLENEFEVRRLLNEWFWNYEFPASQKGDLTFDTFRKALYENPDQLKCIDRYNQLMKALSDELGYNKELGLDLSYYTVFATVNNYLSRRIEMSQSTASEETMFLRAEKKLAYFNDLVLS